MATCKDCLYWEACNEYRGAFWGHKAQYSSPIINASADSCIFYKDCSRFVELIIAEWIEDEDMYGDPIYRCSACNERFVLEEGTPADNGYSYCPNCGAKMDEQALKERERE